MIPFCQIIFFLPEILEINNWNTVDNLYWLTRLEQEEHSWSENLFAGLSERTNSLVYKKQTGPMSAPNS